MQSGQSESGMSPIAPRSLSLTSVDTRGKHRLQAELKRLEQEARFLEEELEQLEKMEMASAACKETNGPLNPLWDRWFEGPQDKRRCRCWIL